MKSLMILVVGLGAILGGTAAPGEGQNPFESQVVPVAQSRIDRLVFAKLKQVGLESPRVCSDAVFFRRVHLDVIGTLPTAAEAREFILDQNPNKRAVLINRLLERDEFATYWAMKWGDMLRIK